MLREFGKICTLEICATTQQKYSPAVKRQRTFVAYWQKLRTCLHKTGKKCRKKNTSISVTFQTCGCLLRENLDYIQQFYLVLTQFLKKLSFLTDNFKMNFSSTAKVINPNYSVNCLLTLTHRTYLNLQSCTVSLFIHKN